ncbi:MAG TPA: hypothetical protein VL357_05985 [Rariglobus sp.]|jgi:hypothetical protein|nr:hypothetical protein [Rariglobus sp.]
MNTSPETPPADREAQIKALMDGLGCTREGAEDLLAMHNDVVELDPDDLQITNEDEE